MIAARGPETLSPFERVLATVPEEDRPDFIKQFWSNLGAGERADIAYAWNSMWARPAQQLPPGEWDLWDIRAGRGFGKTRSGSEGVRRLVNEGRARAVTIIGATAADARDVMIEGPESGLLAVHPPDARPVYKPSVRTVEWPNGALGHVRSAEEPDGIRGLNSELVWGDEPHSWKSGREAWDNAVLGNRIGRPRAILTGTPRPRPWLRELEAKPTTVLTTGSTYENVGNLAPQFVAMILERYEGTRLGAQELHALYLDDVEGALWTQPILDAIRISRFSMADPWRSLNVEIQRARTALGLPLAPIRIEARGWRVLVGVDPPGETAECGIVVGAAPIRGRAGTHHAVILDDMSIAGTPETWAAQVVAAVNKWGAEGAIVEKNQGGDMCRAVIHNIDPTINVTKVSASESKYDRAEPVSALFAKGWVHMVGYLAMLESQLITWVPDEGKSPDRLDALVHLVTALLAPMPVARSTVHSPLGQPRAG